MNNNISQAFSFVDDLFIYILNESDPSFHNDMLLELNISDNVFECISSWTKYHLEQSSFISEYHSDSLYNNLFLTEIIKITHFFQKYKASDHLLKLNIDFPQHYYSTIRLELNKLLKKTKKMPNSTSNFFIIRDALKFNSISITKNYLKDSNWDSIIIQINKQKVINESIFYTIIFLINNGININVFSNIINLLSKKQKSDLLLTAI